MVATQETLGPSLTRTDKPEGWPCGFAIPTGWKCGASESHGIHWGRWRHPEPKHEFTPVADRRRAERRRA